MLVALQTYKLVMDINSTEEKSDNPIIAKMIMCQVDQRTVIPKYFRQELKGVDAPLMDAEIPY